MKLHNNTKRAICALICCALAYTTFAQCPSGTFTVSTQQQVDNFAVDYPNCTEIQGAVLISGTSIANLEGLSQITAIGGNLLITGNEWAGSPSSIGSLAGLENLTTIGGSLSLGLLNNLTDLTGLTNLITIGGRLTIGYEWWSGSTYDPVVEVGNANLSSLNGLDNLSSISDLEIAYNSNLSTCNEPFICNYLQNGGSSTIDDNAPGCNTVNEILQSCTPQCPSDGIFFATQQDIDDFPVNYPNCTEIPGDVIINDSLTASINNLQGLQQIITIGGDLNVDFCGTLNDLTGLENLTNLGGYLRVVYNPAISSFQGLNGLPATGAGFFVRGNPLLTNFDGMENLTDIGNSPMWLFDSEGLNDLEGLSNINANTITDLRIYDNPNLSICNTSNVCEYLNNNSTHQINNNASGCNDVNEVLQSCTPSCPTDIYFCSQQQINDFPINYPNCTEIQGSVYLSGDSCVIQNTDISDLSPLNQITSIGGDLQIGEQECDKFAYGNPLLMSLSGLENLNTIGGNLNIETSAFEDFTGLNGLQTIGGELFIVGTNLTSFNGLNNVVSIQSINTCDWYFSCGNIFEIVTVGNTELTSLEGLDNLESIETVSIGCTPSLTICSVPFVCNLIASGENVGILGGEGCSNLNEIALGCAATCTERDYTALRALYLNTDGDNWTNNTGWFTAAEFEANPIMPLGTDIGTWHGIMLNADGCVSTLAMSDNNMIDSIPATIGNLADLEVLTLTSTQLSGSIPPEIGNLTNLSVLNLSANQLTGNIPAAIGNLADLTTLLLFDNQLSADIPPEIGNLTELSALALDYNQLSGSIPMEIGNLINLERLHLSHNQLSGNIPSELSDLSNLTLLEINDNQLTGCYDENLSSLCDQLTHPWFDGNADISDGNSFDASWEAFCAIGTEACTVGTGNPYANPFKVYPVPAKDFVVFDVPNIAAADEIILYDITGKQINRQAFPQDKQLVVSNLNGGVYIYRIFYEDEVYSGKIVVE